MLAYRALQTLLGLCLRVFFRRIEVVGLENIAAEGDRALIFAGNHPNSLIDPALILATSGRIVHFAAKDVLFKNPALRLVMRILGAVPVARRSDHSGGDVDNQAAFQQLSLVLAGGRAMGIFPEGLSHDQAHIARLKTGAARIALDVAHRHDQPLDIVPCGLTYLNPKRFRSSVLLQYGTPITVGTADADAFAADERATVNELTARIDAGLKELTVNGTDWETVRVLDGVRRLYQPDGISLWHRVELARRFNALFATVRDRPDVAALYQRVHAYLQGLDDLGLTDRDLRRAHGWRPLLWRALLHAATLLLWMPLAAPGLVVQGPVALCVRWAGVRVTPRRDVIATTHLVLGLALHGLLYAAVVALSWWQLGLGAGLTALILLPISAYAALRSVEGGLAGRRVLRVCVRMARLRREIEALRRERGELQDAVLTTVHAVIPDSLEPLFSRPLPMHAAVEVS